MPLWKPVISPWTNAERNWQTGERPEPVPAEVIVDASVVIDAVADPGPLGRAARQTLAQVPAGEELRAPGHLAAEVMSGLWAVANRPTHALHPSQVPGALVTAEALGITLQPIPWADVHRAWALSQSLRYSDALYVAAAERLSQSFLTSDTRIERSGAPLRCTLITVRV